MMLLMHEDAAVTETPGEKRAVVSLTDEEATHNISVFGIFQKVLVGGGGGWGVGS